MPAVVRLGDTCTGHGDYPPRANVSASTDVFINGKGAHRVGDGWGVHCNSTPVCHAGTQATGSPTVFVNGKPLARVGDSIDCGSVNAVGSPNVFAN